MWTTLQPEITRRFRRSSVNGAAHPGATVVAVPSPSESDEAWEPWIKTLHGFGELADDWDGQGASAPTAELLQSALTLAHKLSEQGVEAPSCVVVGVNGTVIFEWQGDQGAYAELEVTGPYQADGYWMKPGHETIHWEIA